MQSTAALPFSPMHRVDGFLPLEAYGLIGDGTTAALVARDGAIDWLCVPRFDSRPLFCRLLDRRGGAFRVAPVGLVASRQFYMADTGVLVTELMTRDGTARVEDALALRSGSDLQEDASASLGEVLRRIHVRGELDLRVELELWDGARVEPHASSLRIHGSSVDLHLWSNRKLEALPWTINLRDGDVLDLVLRWGSAAHRHAGVDIDKRWNGTIRAWRQWGAHVEYQGPCAETVKRAAFGLKMLDHFENGGIVAAPTTSLPEHIGGPRNWDYRYSMRADAIQRCGGLTKG